MQDQEDVQQRPHGASVPNLSAERPLYAMAGGDPGQNVSRSTPHYDSFADAMKPPQPVGLPKICFVGPELTHAQHRRLRRAIESIRRSA